MPHAPGIRPSIGILSHGSQCDHCGCTGHSGLCRHILVEHVYTRNVLEPCLHWTATSTMPEFPATDRHRVVKTRFGPRVQTRQQVVEIDGKSDRPCKAVIDPPGETSSKTWVRGKSMYHITVVNDGPPSMSVAIPDFFNYVVGTSCSD